MEPYRAQPLDGVLFDLDGVLVESRDAVERAWRAWSARRGVDYGELESRLHGRRSEDLIAAVAPGLDAAAEAAALDRAQAADPGVRVLPGARYALASLPADRVGIVTSGSRELAT
ncbi:MAG: HAD family hydrolase, partial [Solirubrobacterales bacterium]